MRLVLMIPALLLGQQAGPAAAGKVRVEGDRIEMSVGAERGYGVFSALERHDLVGTYGGRTPAYHAAIRGLAPRFRGARVVVRDHPGGYMNGIIADVADINALGLPVRIVGRYCHSACTLFLGAKEVCVSPETVFGFHSPSKPGVARPMSEQELRAAIGHSAAHYRPGLRDWWLTRGSRSEQLVYLTGRDLTRFGYRTC
jgi:hypothetical protein